MGKGDKVLFWHDSWWGPTPLALAFSEVFALAKLKSGLVFYHMVRENGQVAWDLYLRRQVNDWEMLALSSLMIRLDRVIVGGEIEVDRRIWQPCSTENFSVQSMYNISLAANGELAVPVNDIWRSQMPSKASFLFWLIHFDKVLMLDKWTTSKIEASIWSTGVACAGSLRSQLLTFFFIAR